MVLHTLVTAGREGIASVSVAIACERDPGSPADMEEIKAALELLIEDGLAQPDQRSGSEVQSQIRLFRPTRAAVRASELSF